MFLSILNDGFNTGKNRSTTGLDELLGQVVPLLRDHGLQRIDIQERSPNNEVQGFHVG
uniref:Uncharacterized protein n=1 Tax=Lepeophtheirus salmonis TaxID=72036 RepID=A0A0K2TVQ1_LEPSM